MIRRSKWRAPGKEFEVQPRFFIKLDLADHAERHSHAFLPQNNFPYVIHLAAQAGVPLFAGRPARLRGCQSARLPQCPGRLPPSRLPTPRSLPRPRSTAPTRRVPFQTDRQRRSPASAFYGATKKANELMAHSYSHLFELPATGLRFFTVYGPWGRPDMAMWIFADAITRGSDPAVQSHGKMRRDFTYVDDVVGSGRWFVSSRPPRQPATRHGRVMLPDPRAGRRLRRGHLQHRQQSAGRSVPYWSTCSSRRWAGSATREMLPMQPGDVPATYADVDDLMRDVGFRPSTPSLTASPALRVVVSTHHKLRFEEKRPGTVGRKGRSGRGLGYLHLLSSALVNGKRSPSRSADRRRAAFRRG